MNTPRYVMFLFISAKHSLTYMLHFLASMAVVQSSFYIELCIFI